MSPKQGPAYFYLTRLLYLSFVGFSFYLLFASRSGEVYTVWQVMNPFFYPVLFVSTFLLLIIIFSSESTTFKLLFAILHSILSHSFMVIIFPAGNIGVQQMLLGQTRLVFDNVIFHGFGWTLENVPLRAYNLVRGENFQTALSVILARMLGIDVYWVHLFLVPILWGIFVTLAAYLVAKILGLGENVSVLSALVISLFPTTIVWGAVSIPNGLSYIFFFCYLYFLLKYLKSNNSRDLFPLVSILLVTSLTHLLAATVATSLFVLALGIKNFETLQSGSMMSKFTLLLSFVLCTAILPFTLIYRRFFYSGANTYFSFEKLNGLSSLNVVMYLLFGSYLDFFANGAYVQTLVFGIGPALGLIGMIYFLRINPREKSNQFIRTSLLLLLLGFFIILLDDRIVKYLMVNVPFSELDRLWVLRDFVAAPFLAFLIGKGITFSQKVYGKLSLNRLPHSNKSMNFRSIIVYLAIFVLLSGWIATSLRYAYPHWGPLQTTSYELDAVKSLEKTQSEKYIVVGDQWIIFAGAMFAGYNNPRAFYFSPVDPQGVNLFIKMKTDPSNDTLIEAMKTNNATVAYFIIEEPRLGTTAYTRIIQQAQQNGLQTYQTFYYKGEEKLHIFYYEQI